MRVPYAVGLFLLGFVLAGTGCRGETEPSGLPPVNEGETPRPRPAPVAGSVTLFSDGEPSALNDALAVIREFNPDLKVQLVSIDSEVSAERFGAGARSDVVLLGAAQAARRLDAAGALRALDETLLDAVPPRFRGPGGRFVALSVRARVIVAKRLMANPPLSVLDLGDRRWRGKIARTPALHPAFLESIAVILGDYGDGRTRIFLGGLRFNTDRDGAVVVDQGAALTAVVKRTVALAWVDHVDFHRHIFGDEFDPGMSEAAGDRLVAESNVEVLYPDGGKGVPWSASVGAITAHTGDAEAAHAVLHALLSDEGQRAYAWPRREHPAVEDLPGPPGTAPPTEFKWSEVGLQERMEFHEDALMLAEDMEATPEPQPTPEDPAD